MSKVNNATTALNNPMTIATQALVKAKVISADIAEKVTSGTKKGLAAALTKKQAIDLMETNGFKSYHFDLSNKDNAETCDSLKRAIALGFDLGAQALLAKETKTLSDLEKATKRALQQQIGSEFGYYRRALAERERIAVEGKSTEKTSAEGMYFKDLLSALDRLGKLEKASFKITEHKAMIQKMLESDIGA